MNKILNKKDLSNRRIYVQTHNRNKDEIFYKIEGLSNYAFSNKFRLQTINKKDKHGRVQNKEVKSYSNTIGGETVPCFTVKDDNGIKKELSIRSLIKRTFFYDEEGTYIQLKYINKGWKLDNIMCLTKPELTQHIYNKINKINIDIVQNKGVILEKVESDYKKFIENSCRGMYNRGVSESWKKNNPKYKNTSLYSEWKNDTSKMRQYLINKLYEYPEKLVIDKDLMGFGLIDMYAPGIAIPLPQRLNRVFAKGSRKLGYSIEEIDNKYRVTKKGNMKGKTFDKYLEALEYARIVQSEYIFSIANEEECKGYLPIYIIEQMRIWAALCRDGKIEIWEPTKEVKEGLLSSDK